jgi:hypothetical protein
VGVENIYPTTLTAIGHYLKDEDIPSENVKRLTQTLVNRVAVIYSTLAERAEEPQKGNMVTISESLSELAAKFIPEFDEKDKTAVNNNPPD